MSTLTNNKNPWINTSLKDIGYTYGGLSGKSKKDFNNGKSKYIPFLNVMNNEVILTDNLEFVAIEPGEKQNKVFPGDILFNTSSETPEELGYCSVLIEDVPNLYLNSFCFGFRPLEYELYDPLFLVYFFRSRLGRNVFSVLAQGATRYNLSKSSFINIKIPLPPLPEQRRIASVLSDMDGLIGSLEKLLAKKRMIRQGMMQRLLTPQEDWEVKRLGEIGRIITGGTPPTSNPTYWNGGIPWVTPTDISEEKNITHTERMISDDGLQVLTPLPQNTLLVTCIASIGKNCILKTRGACNQQINAIIPQKDYDIEFLYYLIERNKQLIMSKAGITATLIVSKKEFEEIEFAFPTLETQKNLANKMIDIDSEIHYYKTKIKKHKQIKQGMMQKLLTGEIRLM